MHYCYNWGAWCTHMHTCTRTPFQWHLPGEPWLVCWLSPWLHWQAGALAIMYYSLYTTHWYQLPCLRVLVQFLQVGCHFCHPARSVRALKAGWSACCKLVLMHKHMQTCSCAGHSEPTGCNTAISQLPVTQLDKGKYEVASWVWWLVMYGYLLVLVTVRHGNADAVVRVINLVNGKCHFGVLWHGDP